MKVRQSRLLENVLKYLMHQPDVLLVSNIPFRT